VEQDHGCPLAADPDVGDHAPLSRYSAGDTNDKRNFLVLLS
jgi:hypothetical protein